MEENVLKGTGKCAYVKGYDMVKNQNRKKLKNEGVYDKIGGSSFYLFSH